MLNKSRRPTRLILSSLFFAVLLCGRVIFAQEQVAAEFVQTFHIVDIKVEGNKKTKPVVILREMKTQSGDTVTLQQLELDQKRIASLGLFSRVEMRAEPEGDGIALKSVV